MKISTDRILTTHVGSLPRPKALDRPHPGERKGEAVDDAAFEAATAHAVDDIVAQQVACGIDIVSDGEMSKLSYTIYIRHRVTGIGPDQRAAEKGRDIMIGRDLLEHPDFAQRAPQFRRHAVSRLRRPVELQGPRALERDLAHLKAAAAKAKPAEAFMTAPRPASSRASSSICIIRTRTPMSPRSPT